MLFLGTSLGLATLRRPQLQSLRARATKKLGIAFSTGELCSEENDKQQQNQPTNQPTNKQTNKQEEEEEQGQQQQQQQQQPQPQLTMTLTMTMTLQRLDNDNGCIDGVHRPPFEQFTSSRT